MNQGPDYWLSREEVASRLKLPVKTVAQWAHQNKGPKYSKIGKFARYKMSDLIAWENAQVTGGAA